MPLNANPLAMRAGCENDFTETKRKVTGWRLKLLYQLARRSQRLDLGRNPLDDLGKTLTFGGGNPGKDGPVAFHADVVQETF